MTPREAKKLVDRALATNPGRRLDGSDEPPVAPLTGTVATEGVLGAGHIDAIINVMARIPATATDKERTEAETILVDLARKASPIEVNHAGDNILARLDPDGREPDTRSMAERYGGAFGEIIELVITSPDLPVQAGERAHIVVTIPFDILKTGYGQACLDFTEQLSTTDTRILACDCGIIPAVLGTKANHSTSDA